MRSTAGFSTPLTTGSVALNTVLQFGGALRKGALLIHSKHESCLQTVMLNTVKSNQESTPVLLAQEENSPLSELDINAHGVNTDRLPIGSKLLRVKFKAIEDLKAFLMLGGIDLICLYITKEHPCLVEQIQSLVDLCKKNDVAIIIFSSFHESLSACYASITLDNVQPLLSHEGEDYGWQFSAKAKSDLHQPEGPITNTETIITKSSDYYLPFDALMAALSAGVLNQDPNGGIFAGHKPFTASFDDALQRLQESIVYIRLINAIITKLPFIRL